MIRSELQRLRGTWESLGHDDPLWAVVSHPDKEGGKWELTEFLRTGEADVMRFHNLLIARANAPRRFRSVLDFGCGVGRLSLAWSKSSERVIGVDISSSMIERGRILIRDSPNVELILNDLPDLRCFREGQFDLVTSHVCLQHMPWALAECYLREFARVCATDGIVAFQLPTRLVQTSWLPRFRRAIVDHLPFGMGKTYRRWRHGRETAFEMYYTPQATVSAAASDAGLQLLHCEPDSSAGAGTEGFIYVFRKSRA